MEKTVRSDLKSRTKDGRKYTKQYAAHRDKDQLAEAVIVTSSGKNLQHQFPKVVLRMRCEKRLILASRRALWRMKLEFFQLYFIRDFKLKLVLLTILQSRNQSSTNYLRYSF